MHPTFLHLGHFNIPVFGVVVALGLMTALTLTQWSARRVGISADRVWNAGMLAIVAVLVVSRLLLVVFNIKSFVQYPLLLLAVPSLTSMGVVLSAILMYGYIRWKQLPLLALLDSCAASGALLWAFINAGLLIDGTRDGMPVASISGVTRAQPVELYSLIAAIVILIALLNALRSGHREGEATGLALAAGGLALFFIDFYRLPSELLRNMAVDPSQIIGVVMVATGGALLYRVAVRLYAEIEEKDSDAI